MLIRPAVALVLPPKPGTIRYIIGYVYCYTKNNILLTIGIDMCSGEILPMVYFNFCVSFISIKFERGRGGHAKSEHQCTQTF